MRDCSKRAFASVGLVLFALMAVARPTSKDTVTYRVVKQKIAPHVIYKFSRQAYGGRLKVAQEGKAGLVKKVFQTITRNGHVVSTKLIREEVVQPKDAIYLMAETQRKLTSRHQFTRGQVLHLVATGYAAPPGRHRGWGRTCTGEEARFGLVAVDPRLIPLGSTLYVEGYGFAKAADTGGAIKGHRIDLCFDTLSEADNYGRKSITVYVLKGR